jgi:undecaprenyl-diphosphatase
MGTIDRHGFLWVVDHRVGWLDPLVVGLTWSGLAGLVWIAFAAILSWRGARPIAASVALVAASVWCADLLASAIKLGAARPRPGETIGAADPLVHTFESSFPSGHAATSFAGAVVLASLVPRGLTWFLLLAAAIAYSRVYVGVHYPLDVAAGALVGAAVGGGAVALVRSRPRLAAALRGSEARPLPG